MGREYKVTGVTGGLDRGTGEVWSFITVDTLKDCVKMSPPVD